MRRSEHRILTSHAGSPPRPEALIEANRLRESGGAGDEAAFQPSSAPPSPMSSPGKCRDSPHLLRAAGGSVNWCHCPRRLLGVR